MTIIPNNKISITAFDPECGCRHSLAWQELKIDNKSYYITSEWVSVVGYNYFQLFTKEDGEEFVALYDSERFSPEDIDRIRINNKTNLLEENAEAFKEIKYNLSNLILAYNRESIGAEFCVNRQTGIIEEYDLLDEENFIHLLRDLSELKSLKEDERNLIKQKIQERIEEIGYEV